MVHIEELMGKLTPAELRIAARQAVTLAMSIADEAARAQLLDKARALFREADAAGWPEILAATSPSADPKQDGEPLAEDDMPPSISLPKTT